MTQKDRQKRRKKEGNFLRHGFFRLKITLLPKKLCDTKGQTKKKEKRRKFFFLRDTCLKTSCFNPLLLKKDYDDDVCEQQREYHWTRRAHEEHYEYEQRREESVSEAKLFHFFRREER